MLDNPYTYIGAIVLLMLAAVLYAAYTAPMGHEDEAGFHIDGDEM